MGDSTCVACGECVQACPTGALLPATVEGDSQDFDEEIESVCPYCGVGCQLSFKVKNGKIKYVEGIDGPANEGRLCVKGRFGYDYLHHPDRLKTPMLRREGRDASDDDAIADTVHALLAASPAAMVAVSLDDALGAVEQANLPGTIDQHPNWRRRLPVTLDSVDSAPGVKRISGIMAAARPKPEEQG